MIKYISYLFVGVLFYFLINEITLKLNIFYPYTGLILSILFLIALVSFEKYSLVSLIAYLLFIICFLFLRSKVENNVNFDFYLFDWLKLIWKNEIVFINIFGNLLLFLPLCFYLGKTSDVIYLIFLIVILEFVQYLTNRGVFDIVDIIINVSGLGLGLLLRRIYGRQK